jgi:hypothetical protein
MAHDQAQDLYSPDCFSRGPYPNGRFYSEHNNVVGIINDNCNLRDFFCGCLDFDQYGGPTFALRLDPVLGDLELNDRPPGSPKTHALLFGSPAIDSVIRGSSFDCPETDERGLLRPGGIFCDAGAFELNARPP